VFREHQPKIARYARQGPKNFARVARFVMLTIQKPLWTVGTAMRDYDRNGLQSKFLYASKRAGCAHFEAHAGDVWERAEALSLYPEALVAYLAEQPGLGLAKAGFLAQLCWGEIGCLDTHNLERYEVHPNAFANFKQASPARRARLASRYVRYCQQFGGAEALWDSWCAYVAPLSPNYRDAEHVSALHCEFIMGE
jgi:hypothetical protein